MSRLEELKKEMHSLEERFLEKEGQHLSAILDPSRIPTDMAALASLEQGRTDTPDGSLPGNDNTEVPKPKAPGEKENDDKEPTDEKEPSDDVTEEDIKQMSAEEVKESLGLALEIAFECVEKAHMILKALTGGQGEADLKDVVDKEMVEKANDVAEEYIELVELMEEIEGDNEPEDDGDADDADADDDKPADDKPADEKPEDKPEADDKSDSKDEEEPEKE